VPTIALLLMMITGLLSSAIPLILLEFLSQAQVDDSATAAIKAILHKNTSLWNRL
jgi:hypothetical protein